jgi:hypothetical protein
MRKMRPLAQLLLVLLSSAQQLAAGGNDAAAAERHRKSDKAAPPPPLLLPGVRAPAYPLFAHSPFVSWWSPSVDPTASAVTHVRNDKAAGMTAMIRVDSVPYRLLGPPCTPNVTALPLVGLPAVWPTRTVYSFAGAGVRVNMTFSTPKIMEDLDLISLPVTLVYFDVAAVGGGRSPSVEIFFESSAQMIVEEDSQPVVWRRDAWADAASGAESMAIGKEHAIFAPYAKNHSFTKTGSGQT